MYTCMNMNMNMYTYTYMYMYVHCAWCHVSACTCSFDGSIHKLKLMLTIALIWFHLKCARW